MMFNLTCCLHFPNKGYGEHEIFCSKNKGPRFGLGELSAYQEPLNGDKNCFSSYDKVYRIPIDDSGKNMLTNKKESNFTITELEVWEVKYI